MRLIHNATASAVEPGATIHMASGPNAGQAWRFEKITEHATDGHRVHVSRSHPKLGRIHREFHPGLFGCSVVIDVQWYADRQRLLRAVGHTAATGLSAFTAAVVAWLVHEYGNAEWGGFLAMFGVHAGS
ncbi:hypothetical protein [Streptomyces fulvoviolaceus]|uniref:hypothetical protein n=1 Tax=Streptomyces fulvoviolaceus TaxID=285535 RepID=UPI0021C23224|nr:hypothetical protein [Streptomyces fulvoviolaceus]MCT9080478.1 hypothetical protein [Streptomyces fulvoviolaceus]